MNATCPKCGKSLKVKDEYAGKRLKCPGCGEAFLASATSAAAPRSAAPAAKPAAAGAAVKKGGPPVPNRTPDRLKAPSVAVNTNVILIGVGVALVVGFVAMVLMGPMRVKRHWEAHQEQAENDVRDVVEYAMKCRASSDGTWNPRKGRGQPTVGDIRMLPDIVRMSVPETVHFDGFGTLGKFEGTYHFEGGLVDCELKTGGLMLPSGVFLDETGATVAGGQRSEKSAGSPVKPKAGGQTLHVTGRMAGTAPSAEIDGKTATVYYPPDVDEDGNVIDAGSAGKAGKK